MDRKRYITDVYSKSWINAREEVYGFMPYDKNLGDYVCEHVAKGAKLLDVAVGTGYPFGEYLHNAGYTVHGLDISPRLIEKCREKYPFIDCVVGDAEDMSYPDDFFDCAYCFHSTWYFPDLNKVIDEMLRVTRPGGLVLFDIQNRNNPELAKRHWKAVSETRGVGRVIRFGKNVAKKLLGRPVATWKPVVFEEPAYPEEVISHLERTSAADIDIMAKKEDDSLERLGEAGPHPEFARLVFAVTVGR